MIKFTCFNPQGNIMVLILIILITLWNMKVRLLIGWMKGLLSTQQTFFAHIVHRQVFIMKMFWNSWKTIILMFCLAFPLPGFNISQQVLCFWKILIIMLTHVLILATRKRAGKQRNKRGLLLFACQEDWQSVCVYFAGYNLMEYRS